MRSFIRRWLGLPTVVHTKGVGAEIAPSMDVNGPLTQHRAQDHIRIAILPAVNGKIIEVGKFKPNPRGPDWTFEHHLVTGDEPLSTAIVRVLTICALESN